MSRRSTRITAAKLATSAAPTVQVEQTNIVAEEAVTEKKRNRRQKQAEVVVKAVEIQLENPEQVDQDSSATQTVKPRRKTTRKPKPEPDYIIPDVERKETKFKGRLGYACLNTILRNKKPASESIFCSRTCRIDSIKKNGMDWVKELGRKNVEDLLKIIQWNEDNKIRLFRLSSEMFPFASHSLYGYSLEYCAPLLAQAGELARKYGHRLTVHPGQFNQLGSPKPGVVEASIRELGYHAEMLDLLGVDKDGVMVIHGGGVYEDKPATIERMKKTIRELPTRIRERLVLENDELCYSAEDLLPICEELDVPLIFDYHHDSLNPSSISPSEIIKRANAIFKRRGIRPKQHLSEPRPGAVSIMEKRAHADRCASLPKEMDDEDVAMDIDLMIEAKDKEQAVLELYRIYGLEEVKHESLRPPAENQTKETKGRKSNKRKKAKETEDQEEDEAYGEDEGTEQQDVVGAEQQDTIGVEQEDVSGEQVTDEKPPRKKRKA